MAVDEPPTRIRQVLEERLGMETASYLMDRPPGGWSNLVTTEVLDLRLELNRSEMREEFALVRSEMREEFASVRTEMREEFASVRTEMREEFALVRSEMKELEIVLHKGLARFALQMSAVLVSGMAVMGAAFGILSRV
jgi:hypothetical protein